MRIHCTISFEFTQISQEAGDQPDNKPNEGVSGFPLGGQRGQRGNKYAADGTRMGTNNLLAVRPDLDKRAFSVIISL